MDGDFRLFIEECDMAQVLYCGLAINTLSLSYITLGYPNNLGFAIFRVIHDRYDGNSTRRIAQIHHNNVC
jgi:hypothetical protein